MSLKIGIDCRFAGTQSGLGRYTRELVSALLRRKDDADYTLFVSGSDHSWLPSAKNYNLQPTTSRHYSLSEQLRFPWTLKTSGIDLLFSPHFNVPLFCPVPFVATIHDLILHRYPNQASGWKRRAYRAVMKHAVRKARALIAVSAFTTREIASVYGKECKRKITVIHEAVSQEFGKKSGAACAAVLQRYGLKKAFFLYVGNCKEHKNVQTLIDAYRSLRTRETELVLVTRGKESKNLRLVEGARILTDVSDHDLPCLYFFAASFVTASLYEGFGLPVLEAAASHCPIIVTNRGALPEIAPPGAKIVEPTVEAIADALREPPEASDPGKMRTWDEVAEETITVLKEQKN